MIPFSDLDQLIELTPPREREAIYLACRIVAMADGRVWREADVLDRIGDALQITSKTRKKIARQVKEGRLSCKTPQSDAGKSLMFEFAVQVATADSRLTENEQQIAMKLGKRLGISQSDITKRLSSQPKDANPPQQQTGRVNRDKQIDPSHGADSFEGELRGLRSQRGVLAPMRIEVPPHNADGRRPTGSTPQPVPHAGQSSFAGSADGDLSTPRKSTPFWKNAWRPLLLVGVTYSVSGIALGWQFQKMPKAPGFHENAFAFGYIIAAFGIVFTFALCLGVGGIGLLIFRGLQKAAEKKRQQRATAREKDVIEDITDRVAGGIGVGFLIIWFGFWYVGPIGFLAGITGGLNLAWFFVHLALTKPGYRMVAYIEHGATCFAILFLGGVIVSGNIPAIVILLAAQVAILTSLDHIAHSDSSKEVTEALSLKNFGIQWQANWRTAGDLIVRGVFLAAAGGFVWMYFFWQPHIKENSEKIAANKEAIRRFKAIGGKIKSKNGEGLTLKKSKATDADLAVFKEFTVIDELNLSRSSITDDGLEHLANIKSINTLDLSKTQITDAGMAHLRDVEIKTELNLSQTRITDQTLSHLNGLTGVKRLVLSNTRITGPGLGRLSKCKRLHYLNLSNTPLYDDDLFAFEALAAVSGKLRIDLTGTKISLQALAQLNQLETITIDGFQPQQESGNDDVLNLDIPHAIAINDKFQVIGGNYLGKRRFPARCAVLVKPLDEDNDGRPDTYLKDANQDGVNDQLVQLGSFHGWSGSVYVVDINNRGQIIGYVVKRVSPQTNLEDFQRGFVIDPLDTDKDGRPDTWFQDGGDGKTNLLMKDLGTFGGKRCRPKSINDAGQIVGSADTVDRRFRGFVIDPQNSDGDGRLQWHQPGGIPRLNTLMVDITGGQPKYSAAHPLHISNRGQIVGEAGLFVQGATHPFSLTPLLDANRGERIWFRDANKDGWNDLLTPLIDDQRIALRGVKTSQHGFVYSRGLSLIVSWTRKDKDAEPKLISWKLNASGEAVRQEEPPFAETAQSLTPQFLRENRLGNQRDTNASGAFLGSSGNGKRSAIVALPR